MVSPGWLNQYICINSQFLAACSRGCLLLLPPLKSQRETNNNNKNLVLPRLNFSSLSKHNSGCADCTGENKPQVGFQPEVIHLLGKPQEQSSAPVSSDPSAGMFSCYNLGFPAIPFPIQCSHSKAFFSFHPLLHICVFGFRSARLGNYNLGEKKGLGLWFLVVFTLQGGHFSIDACWKQWDLEHASNNITWCICSVHLVIFRASICAVSA